MAKIETRKTPQKEDNPPPSSLSPENEKLKGDKKGENEQNHSNIDKDQCKHEKQKFLIVKVKKGAWDYIVPIILVLCNIASIGVIYMMTREANGITRQSLVTSRQNYIYENRPYVFTGYPIPITRYGVQFAYLPYSNSGKTPASKILISYLFVHRSAPYDPKGWPPPDNIDERVMAPNSRDTEMIKMNENFSDTSSAGRIYLIGKIWYSDYWKIPHYTTFAYEWYYINNSFVRLTKYESVDTATEYQTKN